MDDVLLDCTHASASVIDERVTEADLKTCTDGEFDLDTLQKYNDEICGMEGDGGASMGPDCDRIMGEYEDCV